MHFSEILSLLLPESAKNLLLLILSTRCLARNAICDNLPLPEELPCIARPCVYHMTGAISLWLKVPVEFSREF